MMNSIVSKLQKYPHKTDTNPLNWGLVKPNLLLLANSFVDYCDKNKLPVKFTSIIRNGIKGVSVSKTHIEGRAFDCSLIGWSRDEIECCEEYFNMNYSNIGAIPFGHDKGLACVHEDGITKGTAPHLHFQVRPSIS